MILKSKLGYAVSKIKEILKIKQNAFVLFLIKYQYFFGTIGRRNFSLFRFSTLDGLNAASTSELVKHRWVIGAGNTARIRIRFRSEELGQFDQTLNFEIVGTRRRYQLFCRGVCAFPSISREPRVVFPHRKKFRKPEEVVHKKYILSNETFEFGPLLAGKNRDRYREGRYAENMEQLCISNTSPMEAEITFCYQNDTNAATFLIEPVAVLLKPGESQVRHFFF